MYLYVIWVAADGTAMPLYPWDPQVGWAGRPAEERAVARLKLPEADGDVGWPMDDGPAGMETLLLMARETRLPADVDLAGLVAGLPPQTFQDERAAVWFENGEVVSSEQGRRPNLFDATRIDDPVLQMQALLKDKLRPYFTYTRAVSFACRGR
jgi:hypothetical protein